MRAERIIIELFRRELFVQLLYRIVVAPSTIHLIGTDIHILTNVVKIFSDCYNNWSGVRYVPSD